MTSRAQQYGNRFNCAKAGMTRVSQLFYHSHAQQTWQEQAKLIFLGLMLCIPQPRPPHPLPFSPWANLPLRPALSLASTWPKGRCLMLLPPSPRNSQTHLVRHRKTIKIKQNQRLHVCPLELLCRTLTHTICTTSLDTHNLSWKARWGSVLSELLGCGHTSFHAYF